MTSLQARVDLVKSSISSPSTCTPATVATLNELLLPDASEKIQPNNIFSKTSVKTPLSTQSKERKATRVGPKATQASRREGVKQSGLELSPKEKALLATEVINGTLAALSTPAKSQPVIRRPPSATSLRKPSACKSLRRSSSLPHSPLQVQNFERVSSSSDVSTRSNRSSSTSTTLSGHRAIAECSRIAFSCLRALQASRTPCVMNLKPFQLENGMTALIGRLIMLGLDDLALKELRLLKRRLDTALNTSGKSSKRIGLSEASNTVNAGSQTLVEIIDFEMPPPGGAILALAIAIQMHALKLIASSKKPSLFTAVVSKLRAEYPGSPIQLLLKSAKDSLAQKGKAAKQLENLSRLIFSFTPNILSSEDPVALSPKLSAPPEVVLQLQVLGFHSRVLWWELCDHQADIERDLLEPFSRCLAGFARRSQSGAVERYESATLAFRAIQDFTSQYQGNILDEYTSPLTRIYKLLGSLAQDAACLDAAAKWTEIVEEIYSRTGASEIQRWTTTANLLSLKLLISPQDAKVEGLLMIMIEALGCPLKGGSIELDELLLEVSKARRAAVTVLCKGQSAPNGQCLSPLPDSTQRMCESLVLLCPRFSVRYLSKPPDPNAATKVIVRHEQRRQFVAKIASNVIDSALFIIKVFQSENRLTWELMDSTLKDCIALLEGVGPSATETSNKPNMAVAASSYFVRISNLYFAQHLNMRRDADSPKDTQHLRPLRRSIECVQTRPITERQAALINSKLERIADIYKTLGRLDDARNALLALRDGLVDSGVLSAVAATSYSQPLKASWHQNEDASMLARTIGLLLKLSLRLESNSAQLPYSGACWSVEEKGVVLEHSLSVLSKQSRDTLRLKKSIFRELLVLYDPTSFPIRRLRVVTYLLRLDPEHRRDLAGDVRNTLTLTSLESIVDGSNDKGLCSYLPHLRALATSILELQEDHPRIDLLQPHLAVWRSILDECKDYESLTAKVDEIYDLTSHLHSIADFLHMKGLGKVRAAVLRIIAKINDIPRPDLCPDDPVLNYVALGQQYLELGYSGKAGLSFDRARSHASSNGVTTEALLRVQLSYAEYLLAIGNAEKCEEALYRAQTIAANSDISTILESPASLSDRIRVNRLFAEASFVHSLLTLEQGALHTSLGYARRNVRLIRRAWSIMESQTKSESHDAPKGYVESTVEDFSNLSDSIIKSPISFCAGEQAPGPSAWALVSPLFRGLSHLSKVYAYHGMFRETMYYAEQAYKLVKDLGSDGYTALALAMTGGAWLNAGALDTASELLCQAKKLCLLSEESCTSVIISCRLGKLHRLQNNPEAGLEAYDDAQTLIETLTSEKYINNIDQILDPAAILEEEMCKLTLKAPKGVRKVARKKTVSARKAVSVAKISTEICPSTSRECIQLSSLRGLLLRQKASAFMLCKRFDEAVNALKEANVYSTYSADNIDQQIGFAKQLLFQSIEQMEVDPVFGVLRDSTISFPAITSVARVTGSGLDRVSVTHHSPPAKLQANTGGRCSNRSKGPLVDFFDKLKQAQDHLKEAHSMALQVSSTYVIQKLSSLLNTIAIFLSAAGSTKGRTTVHTNFAACSIEIARNVALQRERKAVLIDLNPSNQRDDDLLWPIKAVAELKRPGNGLPHDVLRFQKDYVDIIPPTWTVISMSLSESRQALYLTKIQAGRTPFILRLPIARNNSRDADEQVFDFGQGKAELHDIIDQANYSAHSARDLSGREAKAAWWGEREALDKRLRELLENIEKVWLGGFKGIFSQQQRRPELLARFQKSFQNILDKHLPSRQKGSKKSKAARVTLDTQILELFIGLGDGCGDDCDLDEALTDLLYFVVDVLQFHGERNAYDEIDFDSIVIETQDILRYYYEASLAASSTNEDKHTILILDKDLHAFPWESLPCMDGLPVSRLPSLGCLRERLLNQQRPSSGDQEGHYIDRENGAYILNPGGDLKKTQTTFENDLQSLSGWTGITKLQPSETEVKESLKTKDLYLYFGHGSGSQYIRAKTIKSLEKCAVTILMGCSSGALNDAGDFQPYGPPIDYMLAGCPSLVATLWDVTDKDIDRFAKAMLERWGLFRSQEPGNEQASDGRGKGMSKALVNEKVSLVEAVTKARKACNFRYLTAASVCIYGIPVYFK